MRWRARAAQLAERRAGNAELSGSLIEAVKQQQKQTAAVGLLMGHLGCAG